LMESHANRDLGMSWLWDLRVGCRRRGCSLFVMAELSFRIVQLFLEWEKMTGGLRWSTRDLERLRTVPRNRPMGP
jgi:hypothetical protein